MTQQSTLATAMDRMRRQHDLGVRSLDATARLIAGAITWAECQAEHAAVAAELEALANG